MFKKGLTVQSTIIGLAVLVISLVLILSFYFANSFSDIVNDETCHDSALLRSSFNLGHYVEVGRETIPLQCQAKKICLYVDKKDCGYLNKEGVDYISIKSGDEAGKEIGNVLYDDWNIVAGRGFFQLFAKTSNGKTSWYSEKKSNCVLYAKIKTSKEIENINLESALQRFIPSVSGGEKISYWDYFAGQGTDAEGVVDLRVAMPNIKNYYSKMAPDKEYWVLYVEASYGNIPVLGKIPGFQEGIDWVQGKVENWIYKKSETGVQRFVIVLPSESVIDSQLCQGMAGVT